MRHWIFIIIGSWFLLQPMVSTGQSKWTPNGFRVGIDAYNAGLAFFDPTQQIELSSDIFWKRWHLVTDLGFYNNTEVSETVDFDYQNEGVFVRVGGEINILYKDFRDESLFFGIKYARTAFNEEVSATIEDPLFGNSEVTFDNQLAASWFEMNFGIKFRAWKQLLMGYTVRYMFGASVNGTQGFDVYRVPAYGDPNRSNFGFSYYIYYQLPFKKRTSPKKEK
ncbi:MAG: DUF6048 family protein [Thermonemataceae bacterium]